MQSLFEILEIRFFMLILGNFLLLYPDQYRTYRILSTDPDSGDQINADLDPD
jgi:hypothetical protein